MLVQNRILVTVIWQEYEYYVMEYTQGRLNGRISGWNVRLTQDVTLYAPIVLTDMLF